MSDSDLEARVEQMRGGPGLLAPHGPDPGVAARSTTLAREALESGRSDLAVQLLEPIAQWQHCENPCLQLLGYAYAQEQRMADAAKLFARARARDPGSAQMALALAQSSLDAGLPAVALFQHALGLAPQDATAIRGYASALVVEGRAADAEACLAGAVAASPDWLDGHRQLAALRWSLGDAQGFARSYATACAQLPQHLALRLAWFRAVAQTRNWDAAGAILREAALIFPAQRALVVAEAFLASESGDRSRAETLFAQTQDWHEQVRDLAFIRHGLRNGDPCRVEPVALRMTSTASAMLAWPYLSLIWRLRGDARAQWLDGDPLHVRAFDLAFQPSQLQALADQLRALHTARAPYLEQSVRGGTQTDRHVLLRHEPILQLARQKVIAAVRQYVDALPERQSGHPLLGTPRRQLLLEGSWSVRLHQQGHNVAHTHPMGWISSALYVSLPSAQQLGPPPSGWICFGTAPPELDLNLPPYRQVEPCEGRLVLFPSTMWHSTVPFSDGERLVLAFDVRVPRY